MRVWVQDVKYHFAMALRAVGVGIVVVGFASTLGSEAQQVTDVRAYGEVGAAVLALLVIHLFTAMPPSWTVTDLLKPMQRDVVAVARERANGDPARQAAYVESINALAAERIRNGSNIPRDRRRWLRLLSSLAETDQT